MRKSQFHQSRNNLKPSRKNLNLPEKLLYPFPPPRENSSLKQSQTIELNLTLSRKIPTHRENISTPHALPPINCNPPWKFLNPLEYFSTLLKFLNPSWKFLSPPKISQPYRKNLNPLPKKIQFLLKNLNPSRKNLNPPEKFSTPPEKFPTPPEKITTLPKNFSTPPPPESFSTPPPP